MKTVIGILAATLLGGSLTGVAPAGAAGAVPPVKTVQRSYGDGAVYQDNRRQRVRIEFQGEQGDRVRLGTTRSVKALRRCDETRLTDGGRTVRRDRSGFFRLRHDGVHTFVFDPCPEAGSPIRLQLLKLRVRPLRPAGLTRVPHRRGFVDAVDVTVPDSGPLVVRPTDDPTAHGPDDTFFSGILPPTGRLRSAKGLEPGLFLLEPGRSLWDEHGPITRYGGAANLAVPAEAGDHYWFVLQYDAVLRASTPARYETGVGGPTVALDPGGVPGRVHRVSFTGKAGQWVFVDRPAVGGAYEDFYTVVSDAEGGVVADEPFPAAWRLPAAGDYLLTMVPVLEDAVLSPTLTLRQVRDAGALPADGTPLVVGTTYPGEMVMVTTALAGGTAYRLEASDVALPDGWLVLGSSAAQSCNGGGPQLFSFQLVSLPFSTTCGPNPWLVLFRPGLGASGSVTLELAPVPGRSASSP